MKIKYEVITHQHIPELSPLSRTENIFQLYVHHDEEAGTYTGCLSISCQPESGLFNVSRATENTNKLKVNFEAFGR